MNFESSAAILFKSRDFVEFKKHPSFFLGSSQLPQRKSVHIMNFPVNFTVIFSLNFTVIFLGSFTPPADDKSLGALMQSI